MFDSATYKGTSLLQTRYGQHVENTNIKTLNQVGGGGGGGGRLMLPSLK